jgi:hypothetical protein
MLVRCVHCDSELVAPVRSEFWSENQACHIWHCPKCCACFSSLVSLSDDAGTEPLRRYKSAGPSSLLSNLAADAASARPALGHF